MSGAIRAERQDAFDAGVDLGERGCLAHPRLPVVCHHDHRVALEERVEPAARLDERADRVVAALQRLERRIGTVLVGGVVIVGEVEDEEVEGVAGHEPAADRRRIGVDRSRRPVAPGERRTRAIGAEQVVEEEPLRPHHVTEQRQRRPVRCAAPVGGEVDGGRAEARVGKRLEQGAGAGAEVLPRSCSRACHAGSGRSRRRERLRTSCRTRRSAPRCGRTRRDAVSRGCHRARRSRSRRGTPASATGTPRWRAGRSHARRGPQASVSRRTRSLLRTSTG